MRWRLNTVELLFYFNVYFICAFPCPFLAKPHPCLFILLLF